MNSVRTPFRLEPSQSYKKNIVQMYTCISTYLFFKIFFFDQRSYEKNKIANKFSLSFEAFQFLNEFEVIIFL